MSKLINLDAIVKHINDSKERVVLVGKNSTGKSYSMYGFLEANNSRGQQNKIFADDFFANLSTEKFGLILKIENLLENYCTSNVLVNSNSSQSVGYKFTKNSDESGLQTYQLNLTMFLKNISSLNVSNSNEEKDKPIFSNRFGITFDELSKNPNINLVDLLSIFELFFLTSFEAYKDPIVKIGELLNTVLLNDDVSNYIQEDLKLFLKDNDYLNGESVGNHERVDGNSRIINGLYKPVTIKSTASFLEKSKKWIIRSIKKTLIKSGDGNKWLYSIKFQYIMMRLMLNLIEDLIPEMNVKFNLIIDEPESGLHESAERNIGHLLNRISKSKSQNGLSSTKVIIATHSRLVVHSFIEELYDIVVTQKTGDDFSMRPTFLANTPLDDPKTIEIKKEINKNFPKKSTSEFPEYIANILDDSSAKKLFSRSTNSFKLNLISAFFYTNIILCEGLNDVLLLESMTSDEMRAETYSMSIYGKQNAITLGTIYNAFGINVLFVLDNDLPSKDETNANNMNESKEIYTNNLIKENWKTFLFDINIETHFKTIMLPEIKDWSRIGKKESWNIEKDDFAQFLDKMKNSSLNKQDEISMVFNKAYNTVVKKLENTFGKNVFHKLEK